MTRSRIVLGVVLVLALVGGAVAALLADRRADERETLRRAAEATAERDRRAVAALEAYLTVVAATAEIVYDTIQPVQAAIAAFDAGSPAALYVLIDVAKRGGSGARVKAQRAVHLAHEPPESLRLEAGRLDDALGDLGAVMADLAALPDKVAESTVAAAVDTLQDGSADLDFVTKDLSQVVATLLGERPLPRMLTTTGAAASSKPPQSKAQFLLASGALCATAGQDSSVLKLQGSRSAFLRAAPQVALRWETTLTGLKRVPAPPGDSAQVLRIRALSAATQPIADGLRSAVRAVQRSDVGRARQAEDVIQRGAAAAAKAGKAYGDYGSRTCQRYFAG